MRSYVGSDTAPACRRLPACCIPPLVELPIVPLMPLMSDVPVCVVAMYRSFPGVDTEDLRPDANTCTSLPGDAHAPNRSDRCRRCEFPRRAPASGHVLCGRARRKCDEHARRIRGNGT